MPGNTSDHADHARRRTLASFLRVRREKMNPAEKGLPTGSRRRAPGLLREEIAQIAGISTAWYTWMEQARPINPSVRVLDLLARALGLDAAERMHLFRLARPDLDATFFPGSVPSAGAKVLDVLHGLAPLPAYVTNTRGDVLAWNLPAGRLFGPFACGDSVRGNIIARLFLDPEWRALFPDWAAIAESAVAQYRAGIVGLETDPAVAELIERLHEEAPEFAALWRRHDVRPPPIWEKTLDHRKAGRMVFTYARFRLDGADDTGITLYTPVEDGVSGARLRSLVRQSDDPAVM